ncbi:hydantoinase/oxoprolinase family protein [Verminephrobacter eiseniae]|nr:hydantoinase/oxoprolinase family protein [Verminephrobacter eiseniae]MCW5303521.1 hydantoinase/oxoprolinase family protein [Verminephrobacter eiseniae]MCW8179748.1 hydantoinase/oxoprolinase family protein [Verminephrobacter eiseniae]MCW8188315.1 hydantoinase/oxoprolinase family protein [Verminephrobacter eiseniae]
MLVPGPVFVYRTCHRGIADLRIPTMTPETPRSTLICVDNGGTLTDAIAVRGGRFFRAKAITTAHDLSQCFIESIAALSREIFGETAIERLLQETGSIRYATTQGTNALVQGRDKGPRLGLLLPEGMAATALLSTPNEQALFAALVGERVGHIRDDADDLAVIEAVNALLRKGCNRMVLALDGRQYGARELAFRRVFLRCFPRHFLGAVPLLLAHQLTDDTSVGRRTWTALLNAFLHPTMEHFLYHAEGELRRHGATRPLMIFRNDGNASRVAKTVALKTYSCGPRAGVEGARAYARAYGVSRIVSFDVGGTTTDISMAGAEVIDEMAHGPVAGVQTSFALCNILSAGIGGSSVLGWSGNGFEVGPQSVGAVPGPACFGRGGKRLTMTDVYLLGGWFDPETYFAGRLPIDRALSAQALHEHVSGPAKLEQDAALLALDDAYHRAMADAIAAHTAPARDTLLMAIGGAGPMSACSVGQLLGVDRVIVPHAAAVFCAYGIGFSDVRYRYEAVVGEDVRATFEALMQRAGRDMYAEGFELGGCKLMRSLIVDGQADVAVDGEHWPDTIRPDTRLRLEIVRPLQSFPVAEILAVDPHPATTTRKRNCLLPDGRRLDLPLYAPQELQPGAQGDGPALLEDAYTTARVLPGWRFEITANRDMLLQRSAH